MNAIPSSCVLVTPPSAEPLTLDEARAHLLLNTTDGDEDLAAKVAGARIDAESFCGRQFVTATWRLTLDRFPDGPEIALPRPPVQSVTAVRYLDADGVLQTWSAANYFTALAGTPARVVRKPSVSWPTTQEGRPEAVQIEFVAGYGGPTAVPEDLRDAIRLILGDRWANRGDVIAAMEIPAAARRLLMQHYAHGVG